MALKAPSALYAFRRNGAWQYQSVRSKLLKRKTPVWSVFLQCFILMTLNLQHEHAMLVFIKMHAFGHPEREIFPSVKMSWWLCAWIDLERFFFSACCGKRSLSQRPSEKLEFKFNSWFLGWSLLKFQFWNVILGNKLV